MRSYRCKDTETGYANGLCGLGNKYLQIRQKAKLTREEQKIFKNSPVITQNGGAAGVHYSASN